MGGQVQSPKFTPAYPEKQIMNEAKSRMFKTIHASYPFMHSVHDAVFESFVKPLKRVVERFTERNINRLRHQHREILPTTLGHYNTDHY